MALFQKKTVPISIPMYTLGHQETKLIVGLGNIGKKYDGSRHNFGFAVIDTFATDQAFNVWIEKKDLQAIMCAKIIDGKKVILAKPTTFMNESGRAVRAIMNFYKLRPEDICIVYDELALPLGTLRTARSGSDAGNNGIKSVKTHIPDDFWRIRLGIGPKLPEQMDTADFVLQKFSNPQAAKAAPVRIEAINLLHEWLAGETQAQTRKI
jgi:PTH1 family peptidyl-tRNA hydrolase